MNGLDYMDLAIQYADGVRGLTSTSQSRGLERGSAGSVSPEQLANKAENLLPVSGALTVATEAKLDHEDQAVRMLGAEQLMAKALTDLEISFNLLQAAQDEEAQVNRPVNEAAERSMARPGDLEAHLAILLSGTGPEAKLTERGGTELPTEGPQTRARLSQAVGDTLMQISDHAAETGQAAFTGIASLGLTELGSAVGVIGTDIAHYFGVAEKVTRLYGLFRNFAAKAYEAVMALLGKKVSQVAAEAVVGWWQKWRDTKLFGHLIESLYQTRMTKEKLERMITDSQATGEKFGITIERIEAMNGEYAQHVKLAGKLMKGMRYVSNISALVLPHGALIVGAGYIVLCSYVVLVGGDYVDAESLKILNRVAGVRAVIEANLS